MRSSRPLMLVTPRSIGPLRVDRPKVRKSANAAASKSRMAAVHLRARISSFLYLGRVGYLLQFRDPLLTPLHCGFLRQYATGRVVLVPLADPFCAQLGK